MSVIDIVTISITGLAMVTGAVLLLIGCGATVLKMKVEGKSARWFLASLGLPLFFIAAYFALAQAYKISFGKSPEPIDFTGLLAQLSSPVALIVITFIVFVTSIIYYVRFRIRESQYAISGIPIIDKERDNKHAAIRIENIGKGDFYCVGSLERLLDSEGKEINLDEYNPKKSYLEWDDYKDGVVICEGGKPRRLRVISCDNSRAHLSLAHYEEIKELSSGLYHVSINIFRRRGRKWIELLHLEKEIEIGGYFNFHQQRFTSRNIGWKEENND